MSKLNNFTTTFDELLHYLSKQPRYRKCGAALEFTGYANLEFV